MKNYILLISWIIFQSMWLSAQNVGVGTLTPIAKLHVDLGTEGSNGILFTGDILKGGGFPALGACNRFMYYPARGALRAGGVGGTHWDHSFMEVTPLYNSYPTPQKIISISH